MFSNDSREPPEFLTPYSRYKNVIKKSLVSKLGCKFVEFKKLTTCDRVVPCTAIAVNKLEIELKLSHFISKWIKKVLRSDCTNTQKDIYANS